MASETGQRGEWPLAQAQLLNEYIRKIGAGASWSIGQMSSRRWRCIVEWVTDKGRYTIVGDGDCPAEAANTVLEKPAVPNATRTGWQFCRTPEPGTRDPKA